MNHPDIHAIIDEIAIQIARGMKACLNIDTGEIRYTHQDECVSIEDRHSKTCDKVVALRDNYIEILPIGDEDEYAIMKNFISDTVREGTRLYKRLQSAIKKDHPVAAFNQEIEHCKGQKLWASYLNNAHYSMVLAQIVETIGIPYVKTYDLDSKTIRLMAEKILSGHYCYVSGEKVIISQVVYQPDTDYLSERVKELDTFYTIKEWALMKAEEQMFNRMGGGYVLEAEEPETGTLDEASILAKEKNIRNGLKWQQEEKEDFQEFCAEKERILDFLNENSDYTEDYNELFISMKIPNNQKQIFPDGKYPIPGKEDDQFSEDNPWSPILPCSN